MFEPNISLGNILTIIAFFVGGLAFVYSLKADTKIHDARFDMFAEQLTDLKEEIKKLNEVLVQLALQGGRIASVEERLLSQGRRLDEQISRLNAYIDTKILGEKKT